MGLVVIMLILFVKLKCNLKYFIFSTDVCNMIMCTLFGKINCIRKDSMILVVPLKSVMKFSIQLEKTLVTDMAILV